MNPIENATFWYAARPAAGRNAEKEKREEKREDEKFSHIRKHVTHKNFPARHFQSRTLKILKPGARWRAHRFEKIIFSHIRKPGARGRALRFRAAPRIRQIFREGYFKRDLAESKHAAAGRARSPSRRRRAPSARGKRERAAAGDKNRFCRYTYQPGGRAPTLEQRARAPSP